MQSPETNIACTEELSDFQHGTVIGCHLSNKSVCQISALAGRIRQSAMNEAEIAESTILKGCAHTCSVHTLPNRHTLLCTESI